MSSGRFSFCFAVAACLVSGAAWAEGEGEGTSWTDPPARTAPQEPAKRAESTRTERAPEPATREPTQARQTPPAPTPSAPTQAEQRQEQIRRAVARSTAEREAEARGIRTPRRSVVERPAPQRSIERPRRMSERLPPSYLRERQAARPRSIRRPVYGYADPMPAYERYEAGPPAYAVEDYRARRLAQARSAGYLVMRSRSYAYPDGTVVRRLSPIGGDDFYD
ncbi:hypothetical protein ASG52_04130 [Methylobacterium sp. Leaf456]|uniref:hypothetical protein n=1 Tax=Methylobacterium sp. Leaf456 TaxID=1736382 RepID=UPI0006F59358|nr:hypothetical protein [Methylobacterium sp. Leaf456]KQT57254.1 hypothetical protein ASG52_04130 [Methylobacterium sp. Leaf456]